MSIKAIGLEGCPEELVEAIRKIAEAFEEIVQKEKEFVERYVDRTEIENIIEREEWREAALLSGQRAGARAQAYDKQMQQDKARRALRRRKRLNVDGGFPDW